MGLFGKVRKATRVGRGAARKASKSTAELEREQYERLKAKYEQKSEIQLKAEAQIYYNEGCDGECDTCEYYDWCPADYVEDAEKKAAQAEEADEFEEVQEESLEDPDEGLTEEEKAAKAAAVAYYNDGCDGQCEMCEHYDWCPAEEEPDEDDQVLIAGVTQGDVKHMAEDGFNLAKETAMTAKELKMAMDDITGIFDPRKW